LGDLSPGEAAAERFMQSAAVAWNVKNDHAGAERLQRKALEAVADGKGRPQVVAQVASALADMLYAQQKFADARAAVSDALAAAEAGGEWALYIKLSNNMGAVLRRMEDHEAGRELHEKALKLALEHFGPAHPTATLAR
jgi:tetratricopeptide (TPR) repeat protein